MKHLLCVNQAMERCECVIASIRNLNIEHWKYNNFDNLEFVFAQTTFY